MRVWLIIRTVCGEAVAAEALFDTDARFLACCGRSVSLLASGTARLTSEVGAGKSRLLLPLDASGAAAGVIVRARALAAAV